MSETHAEPNLEPDPDVSNLGPDLPSPMVLPSSRPPAAWAKEVPALLLEFTVHDDTIRALGRRCPFCSKPIRCPTGPQPLIEHMRSSACRKVQSALEAEIQGSAEPVPEILNQPSADEPTLALDPAPVDSAIVPCPGAEMNAPVCLWGNYPWHLHDPANSESRWMTFHISAINKDGDVVRLRSRLCTGVSILRGADALPCDPCARLPDSRDVKRLMERATADEPADGLNLKYYSIKQLAESYELMKDKLKIYRLKGIEANRDAKRLLGKLDAHKQFVVALAQSDVPTACRIVQVALKQGRSISAIMDMIQRAQQGLYSCRTYTAKSLASGLLVLHLAGARCLIALHKSHGLPSASTVNRHAPKCYLKPSVAFPTQDEVLGNIKSMCGPARAAAPRRRGHTLMIDEIALEERIRYSMAEDALIGLCREHADICNVREITGRPISDFYDIKDLLDLGEVHRAKEATVVAIAAFGQSQYTPMVVSMSGTCKTETVEQQRSLISLIINAWDKSPHGRAALGDLWSVATDGDPRRRQAIHNLCTSETVSPTSPLGHELQGLHLLNLACGENGLTHDGDFKHEEKRLASALRSGDGVYINGAHLSPMVIKSYLRLLPDMSPGRLDSLFDNSDRQDVPKAHALLKAIYDASQLVGIRSQTVNRPFVLLGDFVYSFYAPHTTPSMSLSQQLVRMAECAFLLFGIHRRDGSRAFPNQLYFDIQASLKNAFFCVAKTKVIDPTGYFYLLQLGDDRLENQFGIFRTMYSNCNPDLLQLAERSGAAQDVVDILTQYPEWDRQPRRLSLEGASGIDHLNPASWSGNVCVGDVNLQRCWAEGRALAERALQRAGIKPVFDPLTLSAMHKGNQIDLMRPWGRYVGLSEWDPSTVPPASDNSDPSTSPLAGDSGELADITPLEFLLPPCMPEDGTLDMKRGWIYHESRMVHLESVARLVFGTESKEKSTDRLRRVCGYTRYPSINDQSDSILGDLCLIGQLVLALVRIGKEVALAIIRVTSIKVGKQSVEFLSTDDLDRPDVLLLGQVLGLDARDGIWYWNQEYICLATGRGKQSAQNLTSTKPLLVEVQASMVELVNPELVEYEEALVWSFPHNELLASMELLWGKSSEDRHNIPICGASVGFPYETEADGDRLVHRTASRVVEPMPVERCGRCILCGGTVPIAHSMRIHVGKHILARLLGHSDPLIHIPLPESPCGFCGGSSGCRTIITTSRDTTRIQSSSCKFFHKFSYKSAEKTTITGPCTNRPILCPYPSCKGQDPVWSYNIRAHIKSRHGLAEFDWIVREKLWAISDEEIKHMKLGNMSLIPGRAAYTLDTTSFVGTKRSVRDPEPNSEPGLAPGAQPDGPEESDSNVTPAAKKPRSS